MRFIRVAEILIKKIRKNYTGDVSLVIIMDPYLYGKPDPVIYFVPKTGRGYKLGINFILDGTGYEFRPVSWEKLEHTSGEKTGPLIYAGKVLYCASDEDMLRFNNLKDRASGAGGRNEFIKKAKEKLKCVYKDYFYLCRARSMSEAAVYVIGIIYAVTNAVSLLNGFAVNRGPGSPAREIMNMPLIPDDFPELYDAVFKTRDPGALRDITGKLISNTEALIFAESKYNRDTVSFTDSARNLYERLENHYNAISGACDAGDNVTAFFACAGLVHEIETAFCCTGVSARDLPDIIGAYDPEDLGKLSRAARLHKEKFMQLLADNDVKIRRFTDIDELETYFDTL